MYEAALGGETWGNRRELTGVAKHTAGPPNEGPCAATGRLWAEERLITEEGP